jgi:hypothetical protein
MVSPEADRMNFFRYLKAEFFRNFSPILLPPVPTNSMIFLASKEIYTKRFWSSEKLKHASKKFRSFPEDLTKCYFLWSDFRI